MEALILVAGIGGGAGLYLAALALGVRHGIDWDHIAAITDITSTTASVTDEDESWLIGEPGVSLTDESHHSQHATHDEHGHSHEPSGRLIPSAHTESAASAAGAATAVASTAVASVPPATAHPASLPDRLRMHRDAIWYGTLYALGHGLVVTLLGVTAIVAAEFLPSWIDGVMERVVGVTLVFLSAYLFYSIYQYFRGGRQFRIRSRWMLIFAGVQNAWGWLRSRLGHHEHVRVGPQQYGARTSFGIGLIHGIGAETGTQALIIATAVGATSQAVAIAALACFVLGLLISNSFVTLASTIGFVSASRRQGIYVAAGLVAAVFSLGLGLLFINHSTGILPELDPYVRWIGGPS